MVRVSVGLVQIDAVVTDRQGRQVTDLRPADFRVREGGKEQKILHCSYVALAAPASPDSSPAARAGDSAPIARAAGRTITLVVDDNHISWEGMIRLRHALHRYIDERLAPGDRVVILRTGGSVSALEQFTGDVRRLHAAVDALRYNHMGTGSFSATIGSGQMPGESAHEGRPSRADLVPGIDDGQRKLDAFRADLVHVGTLATLRRVVRGLTPLPGRKPVVVFTDGFKVFDFDSGDDRVATALRALTDEANRASVVLYAVDTRGLAYAPPGQLGARLDAEEGPSYMAERTGGLMIKGGNDPGVGLDRVLEDQQGYYLIGYAPPPSFFDTPGGRPAFHKLDLSVRRSGLRVRSRAGFYGVRDAPMGTGSESREDRLAEALNSPFAAAGIRVRLQALFMDDEKAGPSLRAILCIDARDVTFVQAAAGGRQAALGVVAVTLGPAGIVARKDGRFTINPEGAEGLAANASYFYSLDVPVKKPGPYETRVVVRDVATGHMGSASEVVAVPDLEAGRLAVSSILVRGGTAMHSPSASSDDAQARVGRVTVGGAYEYVFQVLNARRDPATSRPRVETQVRVWRGRQAVYEGARTVLPVPYPNETRVVAAGRLNFGSQLEPGDYTLEVTVTDMLAPRKHSVVTQWADLEAVVR